MNRLMIAESYNDADMFYATRILVTDPFVYVQLGKKEYILTSKLEYGRLKKEAKKGMRVHDWAEFTDVAKKWYKKATLLTIVRAFLRKHGVRSVFVPPQFGLGNAEVLRKLKLGIKVQDPFFPERHVKTKEEVKLIEQCQRITEKACKRAQELIKKSKIGHNGVLSWKGKTLTAEVVQQEIHAVFRAGGVEAADVITACGPQGADPHNTGSGPFRAGEPIILDIYPRHSKTRYWSDMTRTVCRGKPKNPIVQKMYDYVFEAQAAGYKVIREGATGAQVHKAVVDVFKKYKMEEYFIHGTGHGVGVDIHEYPSVSPRGTKPFKAGMVITNEPGLYIPGVGGVRIEDTLVVTKTGYRILAKMPKKLIL